MEKPRFIAKMSLYLAKQLKLEQDELSIVKSKNKKELLLMRLVWVLVSIILLGEIVYQYLLPKALLFVLVTIFCLLIDTIFPNVESSEKQLFKKYAVINLVISILLLLIVKLVGENFLKVIVMGGAATTLTVFVRCMFYVLESWLENVGYFKENKIF